MRSFRVVLALLAALTLLGTACKKEEKVGQGLLKKVKQAEAAEKRLGEFLESPKPDKKQKGALGQASPSPTRTKAKDAEKVAIITFVENTPYIKPSPNIQLEAGTILRILNKDHRKRRLVSITSAAPDGKYDTGDIAPGGRFDLILDLRGSFQLGDSHVPFVTGRLEVF